MVYFGITIVFLSWAEGDGPRGPGRSLALREEDFIWRQNWMACRAAYLSQTHGSVVFESHIGFHNTVDFPV